MCSALVPTFHSPPPTVMTVTITYSAPSSNNPTVDPQAVGDLQLLSFDTLYVIKDFLTTSNVFLCNLLLYYLNMWYCTVSFFIEFCCFTVIVCWSDRLWQSSICVKTMLLPNSFFRVKVFLCRVLYRIHSITLVWPHMFIRLAFSFYRQSDELLNVL